MSVMAVGEKRVKGIDDSFQNASIVLVDIEGTTTSISFVKDTLFPYIRNNLQSYLKAHWNDAEFQQDLLLLKEQAKQDEADKVDGAEQIPEDSKDNTMEAVVKNVLWQMDLDRKTTALKKLQGHIMREGYKNGNLKGHVYSDVVPALKTWTRSGRQIYVYSSGSVEAQKLLFGHSEEGDILELFAGHFDTEVGPKVESDSYMNIVKKLDCRSEDIVFLTDLPREAKAAQEAGLKAVIVVREGNELLTEEDKVNFPVIKSFHDFVFEVSAKRQKMCTNDESPANGPVSDTSNSSISEKIEAVEKTEVAIPESAGSGNTRSSSEDIEMMDVSSNDMKPESQRTDNTKMAVEDNHIKESEKIELETDDSKVPKTESSSSSPESKTVDTADVEKDSLKLCSKNAEECDSKEVLETSLTKVSAEVEVSKVDNDVKLNDIKADEKDSKPGLINTEAENAEETEAVGTSTRVEDKASENDSRDEADLETVSGDSKNKSIGTESVSLESESGALETSSEGGKTDFCEVGKVDAGDEKDKFCVCKDDSSNEDANLEEMKTDTQNKKIDVNSTKIEKRMKTESTEMENVKGIDADDVKGEEKIDVDTMAVERKDEISEEMEMGSSAKLGEKDVALKKEKDIESEGNENGKEKGESTEPSGNSAVSEESGVSKLESEVSTKTESDMILLQASEKQSVSDSSVDVSPSQTENNKYASGGNEDPEVAQTECSKSTVNSDTKLANADASPEESNTEESSKEPESADKMLQDKTEDVSDTVKKEDSELITTSDKETAKEFASTDEETKPLESKNEEDDQSKTAEDTAKENGLAFTPENGKGDVADNCPDTKQNGKVTNKEQDVKVKKLSIDGSENSNVTNDDAPTPIAASGSS